MSGLTCAEYCTATLGRKEGNAINNLADAAVLLTLAACLSLLARWGSRNVDSLILAGLSQNDRDKRKRVLRRGMRTAYALAAVFVLTSLFRLFS